VAGFIGSHLLEKLLELGQEVVGLDNFSTGRRQNLIEVRAGVGCEAWSNFHLIEGDVTELEFCMAATKGVDYVIHPAGHYPIAYRTSLANLFDHLSLILKGVANMMIAANLEGIERLVLVTSAAFDRFLPFAEKTFGDLLAEKRVETLAETYELCCTVLRYSEIFGSRQSSDTIIGSTVTNWIESMLLESPCIIYGDGQSRHDFCHVDDVVNANLLAATTPIWDKYQVYDVGTGRDTTLNELYELVRSAILRNFPTLMIAEPIIAPPRLWEPNHIRLDLRKTSAELGYLPEVSLDQGITKVLDWYVKSMQQRGVLVISN
jgi:UDP-N-acetylglucosamine 4-epimerase